MTSRAPPGRLTDILRKNSSQVLRKNAADLASLSATLSAESIETRFLRNSVLINPKSLCILPSDDPTALERYHLFAVYKPPFCPMRRRDAANNYHRVSMESFISSAMGSRDILPTVQRTLSPADVKLRVLNDLDTYASGPMVVSVSDKHPFSASALTMEYDVLVAGHLPISGLKTIEERTLFPSTTSPVGGAAATEAAASSSCTCTYEVRMNAYYSVHPVSLLNIKIAAPPTSRPPCIEQFVRENLQTCVLGDPAAMGDFMEATGKKHRKRRSSSEVDNTSSSSSSSSNIPLATKELSRPVMASHVIAMRGDCDFPRVFTHMREVSLSVNVLDVSGNVIGEKNILYHCRKCFDGVLQKSRPFVMKKSFGIGILDGSWNLSTEFI